MHGFYCLIDAMVLQAVDQLSDDNAAAPPAPSSESAPAAKPKPKPKMEPKPKKASEKKKAEPKKGLKRPASADPPASPKATEESDGGVMKRPASKAAAQPKATSIKRNFYRADGRYGYVINGRECFYVTQLHLCGATAFPTNDSINHQRPSV